MNRRDAIKLLAAVPALAALPVAEAASIDPSRFIPPVPPVAFGIDFANGTISSASLIDVYIRRDGHWVHVETRIVDGQYVAEAPLSIQEIPDVPYAFVGLVSDPDLIS